MSTNDESLKMEDETKLAKLAASLESPLVRSLRRRQARALVSKAMEDLFELFRLRLVPDERPEDYRGGLVLRLARRTALAEELRKNMQAEEHMTAKTDSVERLDRTQPPPKMWVDWNEGAAWCWGNDGEGYRGWVDDSEADAHAKAIAAAWAHYECEHDPPGMETFDYRWDTRDAARAAAWAWYWRRVAVGDVLVQVARFGGAGIDDQRSLMLTGWPRCLTWSDEQVSEVERWLAEGGAPPEVLR